LIGKAEVMAAERVFAFPSNLLISALLNWSFISMMRQ